jgi:membrane-bound serine protease (ClpP class)
VSTLAFLATDRPAAAQAGSADKQLALIADIYGPIGPASGKLLADAIAAASRRQAHVLILRLNTPGGLVSSMRDMITSILASPVPIVGFVAPPGAHAASAGTYILYATHVAAMAPGTNIGAATPVQFPAGPPGPSKDKNDSKQAPKTEPAPPADPEKAKAVNDAAAFIRSLAELRGRNAEWAEKAVRQAASVSASEALKLGVVDTIANDVTELLTTIDGRVVTIAGGKRNLSTRDLSQELYEPGFVARSLAILTNPNIALILMLLGVYGLIFEFANPGSIGPGVAGAICLVLGLYALNQLPLNYAALALLAVGIACLVAEAFTPTFGVLGAGGLAAFILGAALLIDTDVPQFQISWPVIAATAITSAGALTILLGYAWRAQRMPVVSGRDQLIGSTAEVLDWSGERGHVWALGERWQAKGMSGVGPHARVRVAGVEGITLLVRSENGPGGPQSK